MLFIPQFKFNLLSISHLTLVSSLTLHFFPHHFIIQDHNQKLIGKGNRVQDLYIFAINSSHSVVDNSEVCINTVSVQTWHNRLGHLSNKCFDLLQEQLHCKSISNNVPCSICPLAKQRKLSFISHNNLSKSSFDLIHCDIWGPYHIESHSGHRYFLTLMDDSTRFTWLYLLKHKSDVSQVIPKFFNFISTQFGKQIKQFRSDNAKELAFTEFFDNQGVLHQFSCVERPQQNSVAERKHQHLLNVARALFFQSQVPLSFWSDCVLTAAFLINRTPTPLLQNKCPYELLYHNSVDYSTFRVFGCLAYVSTLTANRTKFQPRAHPCIFLGYPTGMKAYKLYDLHSKQFLISRDVIFHEHIFPFHSVSLNLPYIDPFPDLVLPHTSSTVPLPSCSSPSPCVDLSFDNTSLPISLRKSSRKPKPPSYLQEFHCNLTHPHSIFDKPISQPLYPLSNYLSYHALSSHHKTLVLNISTQEEPKFYHQAVTSPQWRAAMKAELDAMEENKTWSVVPLPPGK